MGFFGRDGGEPTPFVAEVLRRIGEEYGGFDAVGPLPPEAGGPGAEVTIHIAVQPDPRRVEFAAGTGIVRSARALADRTEVYDGETMIARFDDLTNADVFK